MATLFDIAPGALSLPKGDCAKDAQRLFAGRFVDLPGASEDNGFVLRPVLTALLFCLAVWAGATCVGALQPAFDTDADAVAQIRPADCAGEKASWIPAAWAPASISATIWKPLPVRLVQVAQVAGIDAVNPNAADAANPPPPTAAHLRHIPLLI